MNARNNKDYPQAKQYGRSALILTLINIIFTMFLVLLTVGLSVGFACANPSNYAYYYSYYGKCMTLIHGLCFIDNQSMIVGCQ